MIKRLPDRHDLLNQLGTQFLLMGQDDAAAEMFEAVLAKEPGDPHAALHLGFVLKSRGNQGTQLERGVELLRTGIQGEEREGDGDTGRGGGKYRVRGIQGEEKLTIVHLFLSTIT